MSQRSICVTCSKLSPEYIYYILKKQGIPRFICYKIINAVSLCYEVGLGYISSKPETDPDRTAKFIVYSFIAWREKSYQIFKKTGQLYSQRYFDRIINYVKMSIYDTYKMKRILLESRHRNFKIGKSDIEFEYDYTTNKLIGCTKKIDNLHPLIDITKYNQICDILFSFPL